MVRKAKGMEEAGGLMGQVCGVGKGQAEDMDEHHSASRADWDVQETERMEQEAAWSTAAC